MPVREWLGGPVRPNVAQAALISIVLASAAATRLGYLGPEPLSILRIPGDTTIGWWLLGLIGLGLLVGTASCMTIGAPVTGMLASGLLSLALPLQAIAMVLIVTIARSFNTGQIGWVVVASVVVPSAAVACGSVVAQATWATLATSYARQARVPAEPFVAAAAVTLLAPQARLLNDTAAVFAPVFGMVFGPLVFFGLGAWIAMGFVLPVAPALPAPTSPRRALTSLALVVGSTACWLALWTWLPMFEHGLHVRDSGGDLGLFRAAATAIAGGAGLLLAWRLREASSLAWAGAGFVLVAGAVAASNTPWWQDPVGGRVVVASYAVGSVSIFAMVVRRMTEDLPAIALPAALSAWLAVTGLHVVYPAELVGFPAAWLVYRVTDAPIAAGCAAWGALLVVASRFVDRTGTGEPEAA